MKKVLIQKCKRQTLRRSRAWRSSPAMRESRPCDCCTENASLTYKTLLMIGFPNSLNNLSFKNKYFNSSIHIRIYHPSIQCPYSNLHSCLKDKSRLTTDELEGHSASEGVPSTPNILPSWSTSYWPGKRGRLKKSSASMHPQLHRSTGVAYVVPNKISGLRYQRVTTTVVRRELKS